MIEEELNHILQKTFPSGDVTVENQSHLHAGHAGSPGTDQSHFHVTIISECFFNRTRIIRHKLVNEAVHGLFAKGLHALTLKLYTPLEYKNVILG